MANLPGMAYRCLSDKRWTMEFVSKGCTDLTGYASTDLIRNRIVSYNDIIHVDDRRRVHEECRAGIAANRPFEVEYRIVTADDQEKWVWERGRPIHTSETAPLRLEGFILDVSERKRTEEALRESEARFRTLYESVQAGVVLRNADGTISHANRVACETFGMAPETVLSKDSQDSAWQMVREDGTPVPSDAHPSMITLRTGRPIRGAVRGFFADDPTRLRWLLINTEPLWGRDGHTVERVLITFQDITERHEAEQALRTASRQWQTTFDSVSDVIWLLDGDFGIQRCNQATTRVFGEQPKQLVGRHCWEVVHQTASPVEGCPLLRMQKTHRRESTLLPIGDRWHQITVDPIIGESGALDGVVHIVSDITERKEAEDRLLAYQAKLRSLASELSLAEERERRRIAGDLHDQTCQSLALSKMKLQAILEHVVPADERTLHQICDSLNETIEGVRELTFDLSSPTLYKFGLEAALEELLQDKLKAEHDIRCHFSDDGHPKPLKLDVRVLLFKSVRELLINIIKHAHAGKVSLDVKRENQSIRITLADDGVGFDLEMLHKAPSRSRSVGLFNIQERLDYIGGELKMYSQPGGGSRFTLIAPLETGTHVAKENQDGN
jgi:PAS domain S-box-containing protein